MSDTQVLPASHAFSSGELSRGLRKRASFLDSGSWAALARRIRPAPIGRWVDQEDDRTSFARLVLPHLDAAYGLARALTGNVTDADDVIQDACLRAFRAVGSVTLGNARAWLLTIVHHTAFTWLAKNRSSSLVFVEDPAAVETSASEMDDQSPEAAIIAKADAAQLESAIMALPLPFRETLILRDSEGLSYRQIAQVTGVPVGTVMSRLARARERLMLELGRRNR